MSQHNTHYTIVISRHLVPIETADLVGILDGLPPQITHLKAHILRPKTNVVFNNERFIRFEFKHTASIEVCALAPTGCTRSRVHIVKSVPGKRNAGNTALSFTIGSHQDSPESIPEMYLIAHNVTEETQFGCSFVSGVWRCVSTFCA